MKMNDVRSKFIKHFKKNGHEKVESDSLVPRNDPTLMFTAAGMVQFKNIFTGLENRSYTRATTSQKCLRAGGKHNDLDNVGYTARHHTFFEMLGNFSFGDYFKEEAINQAWDLITKEFGIDKKRLLVTVYHDDDEAFNLWKSIGGLTDDKIIRISTSDNFWSMGDTGPCGPCSEIFFDHGDKIPGGPPGSPDEDGDRFIEIWNLVFMQYEQTGPGTRLDLPKPSIDTGMGLERITAVLQGTHDNYEIDLFKTLIQKSEELTDTRAIGENKGSHRVIADHLRAASFLIAENILPSNEGRGYVLRRIMRRGMRHAHLLGAKEPIMDKMVSTLVREMGTAYPELIKAEALITETLHSEDIKFRKTLARGLSLLDEETEDLSSGDTLSGDVAFKLYDTYGFPLDLTQDALKSKNIAVDVPGFNDAMDIQRQKARDAWTGTGDSASEKIWFDLREKHGATDFLGYVTEQAEGEILALVKNGEEISLLATGEKGYLIANQTPFYGQSGGQVGDKGIITFGQQARFIVTDTKKMANDLFAHFGEVENGTFEVGQGVDLQVDHFQRQSIRSNHSATHLLHEALRRVLGTHVAQKGSEVDANRLRFDFSHTKPVSLEEIKRIEQIANSIAIQNSPVETRLMDQEKAISMGAMALFGEKYGDEVRVVSMGISLEKGSKGKPFSIELCGGTHVSRTGDIGLIKIVSESSVASGVRRIEAITGDVARVFLSDQDKNLKDISRILSTQPSQAVEETQKLLEEMKRMRRDLSDAKKQIALGK